MSRTAWGADWARYHQQKQREDRMAIARNRVLPCIYLLYKRDGQLSWFGNPEFLIKVGRSARNSLLRSSEQSSKGFKLMVSWPVPIQKLRDCEVQLLRQCNEMFGRAAKGRETYRTSIDLEQVRAFVEMVVRQYQ